MSFVLLGSSSESTTEAVYDARDFLLFSRSDNRVVSYSRRYRSRFYVKLQRETSSMPPNAHS